MAALAACSGFRTMRPNALIGLMLDPVLRVVLTAAAISSGSGLDGVLRAFVVVPYITAVLALIWLAVLMRGPRIAARFESGEIMRFASVAWLATFTTQALLWVDQLILPLYVSSAELAIYSVATSVVVLATFAMSPISQSLAPRVADLTRRRELRRLGIAYKAAASWMLRFALPFFAIIFIFPRPLLGVFGTGYGLGATVTVILAFGKLTDVATGPCGTMLNQAGLNKLSLLDNVVALAINIGLNFLLIPEYGIRGAAVAWTISLVLVNAARALQVRRYIVPVWPFSDGTPKALAAFAWSVLAALVVRELVDGSPRKELYIATPVVFGLYITLVVALGLTAEDRLVLGDLTSILRRRRRAPRPSAPGDTVRRAGPGTGRGHGGCSGRGAQRRGGRDPGPTRPALPPPPAPRSAPRHGRGRPGRAGQPAAVRRHRPPGVLRLPRRQRRAAGGVRRSRARSQEHAVLPVVPRHRDRRPDEAAQGPQPGRGLRRPDRAGAGGAGPFQPGRRVVG